MIFCEVDLFLGNVCFIDLFAAHWTTQRVPILLVVLDKVVVAVVVKLVCLVARQLLNLVPIFERHVANWAFGSSARHTQLKDHRLSEAISKTLDARSFHFVVFVGFTSDPQSLLSYEF